MDSLTRNLNEQLVINAIDAKINDLQAKKENYLKETENNGIDSDILDAVSEDINDDMDIARRDGMIAQQKQANAIFAQYVTERLDKSIARLEKEKQSFLDTVKAKKDSDQEISELTQKKEEILQSKRRESLLRDQEQCMAAIEEEKGKYISESRGTYVKTDHFTFTPTKMMQEYEADLAKINSELETLNASVASYTNQIESVQNRNTELSNLMNRVFEKYHIAIEPEIKEIETESEPKPELTPEQIQQEQEEAAWQMRDEAQVSAEIERAYLEKEQAEKQEELQEQKDTNREIEEFRKSQEKPQPEPENKESEEAEPGKIEPETSKSRKNPFLGIIKTEIPTNVRVALAKDSIVYETKTSSEDLTEDFQEDKINLNYSEEYINEQLSLLEAPEMKPYLNAIKAGIDPNIITSLLKRVNNVSIDDYISILRGSKNTATTIEYDFRDIYDSKFNIEEIRKIEKIAKAARKLNKSAISIKKDNLLKRCFGNIKKRIEFLRNTNTKMLGKGAIENRLQQTETMQDEAKHLTATRGELGRRYKFNTNSAKAVEAAEENAEHGESKQGEKSIDKILNEVLGEDER